MKANKDETMITEMEYVNMMKDSNFRASVLQGDHSFFRSMIHCMGFFYNKVHLGRALGRVEVSDAETARGFQTSA